MAGLADNFLLDPLFRQAVPRSERKDSNNELLPTVRVIVPSKLDISSLAAVVVLSLVKSKAH
jgi:hypothetical protein